MAAVGALGVGSGLVSGTKGENDDNETELVQRQEVDVSQSQTVRIDEHPAPVKRAPMKEPEPCAVCETADGKEQRLGTILIWNLSHCQVKVNIEVTGRIALEGEELEDGTTSVQVPPKGECRLGFTGSLVRLESEDGNVDFRISQRSESDRNHCDGEDRIFRDEE